MFHGSTALSLLFVAAVPARGQDANDAVGAAEATPASNTAVELTPRDGGTEPRKTPPPGDHTAGAASDTVPQFVVPREGGMRIRRDQAPREPAVANAPWYRDGLMPLLGVLAAIASVAYVGKRWMKGTSLSPGEMIRVLARTHLSPKQSIALVQMGEKLVFVGVTPQTVSTLRVVDDPDEQGKLRGGLKARGSMRERAEFDRLLTRESSRYIETLHAGSEMPAEPGVRIEQVRGDLAGLLERLRARRPGDTVAQI